MKEYGEQAEEIPVLYRNDGDCGAFGGGDRLRCLLE